MRFLILILTALGLAACSLYQSPGRKFLEKQAYEFAGVSAEAHLTGCQYVPFEREWVELNNTPLARIYTHETAEFQLRVFPLLAAHGFSCDFQFTSAQEMFEKMDAAVDLTISHSTH